MQHFRRWGRMCAAVAMLKFAVAAHAVDGAAMELGAGDEDSLRGGLAVQWDWPRELLGLGSWFLGGYWEVSASFWDGDEGRSGNGTLAEIGVAPVFRIQPRAPIGAITPYLEGGIGLHLFSETEFGDRDFDIPFSFGDHLGAGLRFGPRGEVDVGYRFQHLSNASIGDSNPGINFHLLRLGYHF
ncbi:MAG: Lipid A deacylase PagL [Gammaproteobacteria bacterium]|nr:Lipid A deacylase PagL [Gammaproteobacteria bacterium]